MFMVMINDIVFEMFFGMLKGVKCDGVVVFYCVFYVKFVSGECCY